MSTRQSILDAALPIFATHGFRGATVRDLCAAADVNVAAINYHFGDKAALYAEVLTHAYATLSTRPMPTLADLGEAEAALQAWVHWYIDRMLGGQAQTVDQLMVHELSSPTGALETLAQRGIQPVFDALREIIAALAPVPFDNDTVARFALTVVGQCLIYRGSTGLLQQLEGVPVQNLDAIADHIAAASIAAVRHATGVRT